MKKLIVNADDFGLHESINDGIVEANVAGCVTSASLMAGGAAFEHAVQLAKRHARLGVGAHLTLVGAHPVARGDVHTLLTETGTFFPSYGQFIKQYLLGRIAKAHIEYELRCQMQKIVKAGVSITHIDSHQHLHVLPGMPDIIARLAREFNIRKIRIPAEPIRFWGRSPASASRHLARGCLTACAVAARRVYNRQGFASPQYFFGMLNGGDMSQAALLHIINSLPHGIAEIMVHPGANTQELRQAFPWGYHWQAELAALKSSTVLEKLQKEDIALVNFNSAGFDECRSK